jgi:hypothetical protein
VANEIYKYSLKTIDQYGVMRKHGPVLHIIQLLSHSIIPIIGWKKVNISSSNSDNNYYNSSNENESASNNIQVIKVIPNEMAYDALDVIQRVSYDANRREELESSVCMISLIFHPLPMCWSSEWMIDSSSPGRKVFSSTDNKIYFTLNKIK